MVLVPVRHTKAVVFQDRFYILPGSSGLMAEEGCFSVVLLQGVGLQWLIFDANFTIGACYFFPFSCQSSMYDYVVYVGFACTRRWLENIPMSPMEGCPTVFQVVWNLTPGYHQVCIC